MTILTVFIGLIVGPKSRRFFLNITILFQCMLHGLRLCCRDLFQNHVATKEMSQLIDIVFPGRWWMIDGILQLDIPDVFLELHQFPDVFQQSQHVPCSTCSPSIFPTSKNPRNPTLSGARHAGRRTPRSVPASQTCYSNWKRCADDAFAPRVCAPPISRSRCGIPWLH